MHAHGRHVRAVPADCHLLPYGALHRRQTGPLLHPLLHPLLQRLLQAVLQCLLQEVPSLPLKKLDAGTIRFDKGEAR
jgi:hypothetical protein